MWTPHEVRKLIALISGILMAVAGVYLMIGQIQTEGKISFNSDIVSGDIESGSAGLLLCFLATFIIVFSIMKFPSFPRRATESVSVNGKEKNNTQTETLEDVQDAEMQLLILRREWKSWLIRGSISLVVFWGATGLFTYLGKEVGLGFYMLAVFTGFIAFYASTIYLEVFWNGSQKNIEKFSSDKEKGEKNIKTGISF